MIKDYFSVSAHLLWLYFSFFSNTNSNTLIAFGSKITTTFETRSCNNVCYSTHAFQYFTRHQSLLPVCHEICVCLLDAGQFISSYHVFSLGSMSAVHIKKSAAYHTACLCLNILCIPVVCQISFKISSVPFQNYHSGKEVACSVKSIAA